MILKAKFTCFVCHIFGYFFQLCVVQPYYYILLLSGTFVEVALTGTALPVLLEIQPKQKYDFGECPVGERVDLLCSLNNNSNVLPAAYEFRKIAHFSVHPPKGKIAPRRSQDIVISFAPNQVGM